VLHKFDRIYVRKFDPPHKIDRYLLIKYLKEKNEKYKVKNYSIHQDMF
jgi:hypothetical protein